MTNTTTTHPARNAARAVHVAHVADAYNTYVPADVTRAAIIDAYPWFDGDDVPVPAWYDPSMTTIATLPMGVIVRTDIDPATVIGTHRPRWVDPSTLTVVDGAFGRNAAVDPSMPDVGVGRGYVRPFIRDTIATGHAANHGDNGDGTMTCRSGDACIDDRGPTMTVRAFPTLSRATADGRTRADRCRACRDAR